MYALMDFSDWLVDQIKQRGWSQADLSRMSGLTRQSVSDYINRRRTNPDHNALTAISKAFKIPPEAVFRAAGLLPPTSDDPWADSMNHKISNLTGVRRELAERLVDTLLAEQDRETQSNFKPHPSRP